MLVTFSSKAGADVLMLAQHAKPLLAIIGKPDDQGLMMRGVLMPEHLGLSISRLEQAIAAEPLRQNQDDDQDADQPKDALSIPVGLRQRSYPLLDLLKRAQTQQVPVMWEAGSGW